MSIKVIRSVVVAQCLVLAASSFAAAHVEQKAQVHFGGAIGGLVNVFAGKAAKEGLISSVSVRGDRKSTVTGNSGEIIDLAEEKVYRLDYENHTYRVQTFAEIRKQLEDAQKRGEKSTSKPDKKGDAPEYEVDFDIQDTGKKQVINGYNTRETVVTITVREKGKTLQQSGGAVMTNDLWMGPKIAVLKEVEEFDRRYAQKIFSGVVTGADLQQMAMLVSQNPAFGKAMKKFQEKRSSFEGTPIRTEMSFRVVGGTESKDSSAREESPSDSATRAVAGLLGRMKKRGSSSEEKSNDKTAGSLFNSSTEILKADSNASATDLAIPAGFKQSR